MKHYKAIFYGGKTNGRINYYQELKHAKQTAKRYVNSEGNRIGGGYAFVEIYYLDEKYKLKYVTTID